MAVGGPPAVLLACGLLQLREALEAQCLGEAHDGRARGVGAPRQGLGRLERRLVEVVHDVLRDVLLRARELVEAVGDVDGEGLVAGRAAGGRRGGGSTLHGSPLIRLAAPRSFRRPCSAG